MPLSSLGSVAECLKNSAVTVEAVLVDVPVEVAGGMKVKTVAEAHAV